MHCGLVPDGALNLCDLEAAHILDGFLPNRLFDAHAHMAHREEAWGNIETVNTAAKYDSYMKPMVGERELRLNIIPFPCSSMAERSNGQLDACNEYVKEQLKAAPSSVAEILVHPLDKEEDIGRRIFSARVRGIKCYHSLADRTDTYACSIGEYLPEAAWNAAQKHGLAITLHMVRDCALADPINMEYIKRMAAAYPDVVLILAHAARSFASWTGLETVRELVPYENVWFDFSAVCESPVMAQILKLTGTKRSMWGSDYPISTLRGKAISLADGFYWIGQKDLENMALRNPGLRTWAVITENLMAVRQACILADLNEEGIEDLFYNNASRLFDGGSQ